jgi:hypothetical protein
MEVVIDGKIGREEPLSRVSNHLPTCIVCLEENASLTPTTLFGCSCTVLICDTCLQTMSEKNVLRCPFCNKSINAQMSEEDYINIQIQKAIKASKWICLYILFELTGLILVCLRSRMDDTDQIANIISAVLSEAIICAYIWGVYVVTPTRKVNVVLVVFILWYFGAGIWMMVSFAKGGLDNDNPAQSICWGEFSLLIVSRFTILWCKRPF